MSVPVFNQQPLVGNRPCARKDAQSNVIPSSFYNMAFQGVYSGTNLIYAAFARPGSSTGAAVWQIFKLTYDGSNNLLSITWPQDAGGSPSNDYQFIQTGYAGYTYA